jgi:hypothetical protein
MFYKVAAGLCIYFIVSSAWGLAERQLLPKKKPTTGEPAVTAASPGQPRQAGTRARRNVRQADPDGTLFGRVKEMWSELLKQAEKK